MRHKFMTKNVRKTVALGLTAIMLATCAGKLPEAKAANESGGAVRDLSLPRLLPRQVKNIPASELQPIIRGQVQSTQRLTIRDRLYPTKCRNRQWGTAKTS